MTARSVVPRLLHMLEAIADARAIASDSAPEEIEADRGLRLRLERNFEIISEASRHPPEALKGRHPAIPWRNVAGIGNVIRHDYDQVAARLLWKVARDQLPALDAACREELARVGSDGAGGA